MNGIFIDANIFLEVQLNQKKASECKQLLKFIETSKPISWINSFLLFSMILTVQHKTTDLQKCQQLVLALGSYKGLNVFNPSFHNISSALKHQKEYQLDFDDALVLASMNDLKISIIATFDKDFDRVDKIKVVAPSEALEILQVW